MDYYKIPFVSALRKAEYEDGSGKINWKGFRMNFPRLGRVASPTFVWQRLKKTAINLNQGS
jgi:hypothetical protein